MTPKELKQLIITEEGREKLYKRFLPTFELVDNFSDQLDGKDLLTEYELKDIQQKLTGAYMKLYIVADTIDTIKTNTELDYFNKEKEKLKTEKKKVNVSELKEETRANSSEYRDFRNNFVRYYIACEKAIITCQSILKKHTNEKGFKGVDHTGEIPESMQGEPKKEKKDW